MDSYHTTGTLNPIRSKIITELIQPAYYKDVEDTIEWRYRWRKLGNCSESTSHLFMAISTILAFAAGFFGYEWMSFISGCSTVIAGVLMKFTAYASHESKERTQSLNAILEHLNMKKMPSININPNVAHNANNMSEMDNNDNV